MAAEAGLKLLIFHYVIVLLVINLPSECDERVYLPRLSSKHFAAASLFKIKTLFS